MSGSCYSSIHVNKSSITKGQVNVLGDNLCAKFSKYSRLIVLRFCKANSTTLFNKTYLQNSTTIKFRTQALYNILTKDINTYITQTPLWRIKPWRMLVLHHIFIYINIAFINMNTTKYILNFNDLFIFCVHMMISQYSDISKFFINHPLWNY